MYCSWPNVSTPKWSVPCRVTPSCQMSGAWISNIHTEDSSAPTWTPFLPEGADHLHLLCQGTPCFPDPPLEQEGPVCFPQHIACSCLNLQKENKHSPRVLHSQKTCLGPSLTASWTLWCTRLGMPNCLQIPAVSSLATSRPILYHNLHP